MRLCFLISCLSLVIVFSSCEKQPDQFLNLFITPDISYATYNSGENILFNIKISSSSSMSELFVIQTINNTIIDTLLQRDISGADIEESFSYIVPNITDYDTSEVLLLFSCTDVNGKSEQRAKLFNAVSSINLLSETTGHTMYSAKSTEFNAYDL